MRRRKFLTLSLAGAAMTSLPQGLNAAEPADPAASSAEKRYQKGLSPWPICLDTATIRPASLEEKVRIAAEAGYDAIEPWDSELAQYENEGGDLRALGQKIRSAGMFVPSVIGLWNALPPTKELFEASLKDTRNRMRMASEIGSEHIQTIPNTVGENFDPSWVSARYRDLIHIGRDEFNIKPALVFVKFFPLKRLGQAAAIALDANHPGALIIPDTYHMHISEGGFEGLKFLNGELIAIFQFADSPASDDIHKLEDKHRVYPGDGVLPLPQILYDLKKTGYKGCISLELYNPDYWKQDLLEVARTGLKKTLAVIREAGV